MGMGDRIREAMEAKAAASGAEYSQSDLSRAISVTPQTVQLWLANKTSPRRTRIRAIATALGCDPIWLETGHMPTAGQPGILMSRSGVGQTVRDSPAAYEVPADSTSVPVSYYPDISASAGHGCLPISEATVMMMRIARSMLEHRGVRPEDAALLQADGDSMRGTVNHGDMMLINTADRRPRDGRVFVVSVGEDVLVKRIQRIPNGIKLIADNPAYDAISVMDEDQATEVSVVGRVVIAWQSHDLLE